MAYLHLIVSLVLLATTFFRWWSWSWHFALGDNSFKNLDTPLDFDRVLCRPYRRRRRHVKSSSCIWILIQKIDIFLFLRLLLDVIVVVVMMMMRILTYRHPFNRFSNAETLTWSVRHVADPFSLQFSQMLVFFGLQDFRFFLLGADFLLHGGVVVFIEGRGAAPNAASTQTNRTSCRDCCAVLSASLGALQLFPPAETGETTAQVEEIDEVFLQRVAVMAEAGFPEIDERSEVKVTLGKVKVHVLFQNVKLVGNHCREDLEEIEDGKNV